MIEKPRAYLVQPALKRCKSNILWRDIFDEQTSCVARAARYFEPESETCMRSK
jgi:hypothetical protein